jgi:hypothetical protein
MDCEPCPGKTPAIMLIPFSHQKLRAMLSQSKSSPDTDRWARPNELNHEVVI